MSSIKAINVLLIAEAVLFALVIGISVYFHSITYFIIGLIFMLLIAIIDLCIEIKWAIGAVILLMTKDFEIEKVEDES